MRCQAQVPSTFNGIMLVGEAPGEQEEMIGLPFIGAAGQELTNILREAGIDRSQCYITNVFQDRPPMNKLEAFCVKALEAKKLDPAYAAPAIGRAMYVHPARLQEVSRLAEEIKACQPKVIIALGNTALWALCNTTGMKARRGTIQECLLVKGFKVFPTFHPSYILRQFSDRAVMVADLIKAKRESAFPEIRRPMREVLIEPTIQDLYSVYAKVISAPLLSIDIETARRTITCIGFAWSRSAAIVVPFVDRRQPDYSYWSASDEPTAMAIVRQWLLSPVPKIFQNGLYDIQYIWKEFRCPIRNCLHDTMIRHHAVQMEMEKSLGFMGSLYTQEASWKLMRKSANDQLKRDE